MNIVILAGGSGLRLWPLSRPTFPKQFLSFSPDGSFLQITIKRFLTIVPCEHIFISTQHEYLKLVAEQVRQIDPRLEQQILLEPCQRNTAPAALLAAKWLKKDEPILLAPSDHWIGPEVNFDDLCSVAQVKPLVVFGVPPKHAETSYGYILTDALRGLQPVRGFFEKPDQRQAEALIQAGNCLWNTGFCLFQPSFFLKELALCCLELSDACNWDFKTLLENFHRLPEISLDHALLEKTNNAFVIPLHADWSDAGSWNRLYDLLEKDEDRNVKRANVETLETKNCFILSEKKIVRTIGLEDLVIVETDDALFISKKDQSHKVKDLLHTLRKPKKR